MILASRFTKQFHRGVLRLAPLTTTWRMAPRSKLLLCGGLLMLISVTIALFLPPPVAAKQAPNQAATIKAVALQLEKFAEGFTQPVKIARAEDDRLFVIERKGYIYVVQSNGVKVATPFLNIVSRVGSDNSEQGLLGLAFDPTDANIFYVNYTNLSGDTVVARYKVAANNPNLADPNSEQIVLTVDQPAANHNGGDLAFGSDGELYIPLGDGGGGGDPSGNGQNLSRLLGKILRIHVSGVTTYTIPAGNPFANDSNPNTRAEIWSYGWRNPWRFSFDRSTGDMFVGDVGQSAHEEVDFEPVNTAGRNYGWNRCEGTYVYPAKNPPQACPTNAGFTMPIFDYGRSDGCAVTGGYLYRGATYPNLVGHYLFADFCTGNFWDLMPNGSGGWNNTKLGKLGANSPSSFGEDHNGELYVADYGSGIIYHIKDTAQTTTPTPTSTPTPTATPTVVATVPTVPPPRTPWIYMSEIHKAQ